MGRRGCQRGSAHSILRRTGGHGSVRACTASRAARSGPAASTALPAAMARPQGPPSVTGGTVSSAGGTGRRQQDPRRGRGTAPRAGGRSLRKCSVWSGRRQRWAGTAACCCMRQPRLSAALGGGGSLGHAAPVLPSRGQRRCAAAFPGKERNETARAVCFIPHAGVMPIAAQIGSARQSGRSRRTCSSGERRRQHCCDAAAAQPVANIPAFEQLRLQDGEAGPGSPADGTGPRQRRRLLGVRAGLQGAGGRRSVGPHDGFYEAGRGGTRSAKGRMAVPSSLLLGGPQRMPRGICAAEAGLVAAQALP